LPETPSLYDSTYKSEISTYINDAHKEKYIKDLSGKNKKNLNNVISACYYLENDHENDYQSKDNNNKHLSPGIQLNKKI
jgi:hypothetical protein